MPDMNSVIQIENLSKLYRLGSIGAKTFRNDLRHWWEKNRQKQDPYQEFGDSNIKNRSEKSDHIWALKNINLEIKEGDILGIIGKNGAGKSTLLKILSRITSPTTGMIKIKGRIASLLEIGTGFHPELTGRENIYLNGAVLGMTKIEIDYKLDEIVDFSGIELYIDTPVKRYSSGMYVRLGFAVAAHLDPEILIVDEVLAVGDYAFQKKCLGKLDDISTDGKTVIFVSHNIPSIQKLCTKAGLLHGGKLVHLGETNSVIENYLERKERLGGSSKIIYSEDQEIQLKFCGLLDKDDNIIYSLNSGDDMVLSFLVDSKIVINDATISIGINTNYDIRVSTLHSKLSNVVINLNLGQNHINCRTTKFYLSPGEYNLDVKIYDSKGKTIIWAPGMSLIKINSTDFFGSGKMPEENWLGLCLVQSNWEVN